MNLCIPSQQQIRELMSWFDCYEALAIWSGPNFRYPFTEQTFREDLKLHELESFVLIDDGNDTLAFGQYYLRAGHCHLGRLIVKPKMRGRGIAKHLINALINEGTEKLNLDSSSLFVLERNITAFNTYSKMGFKLDTYPEPMPIEGCLYLTKSTPRLSTNRADLV